MLDRLETERAAGEYLWDVFIGGFDTLMIAAKPLGLLDPIEPALILPEVRDPSHWAGGRLPFFDNDGLGLSFMREAGQYFFVNTTRIDPDSITTYRDFLDPRWKGGILLTRDPRARGHGRSVFTFFFEHPNLGPDFVRTLLTEQDLIIPEDDEETDHLLVSGQYSMCICNRAQGARLREERLPFVVLDPHRVREGIDVTASFANLALVNRAPHPNAARVFINWLLSRDTAELVSRETGVPSTRADVPKDFVPPGTVPDPSWLVVTHEGNVPRLEEAVRFIEGVLGPLE